MFPNSPIETDIYFQGNHENYQNQSLQRKKSAQNLRNSQNSQSSFQQINQQSLVLKVASLMHELIKTKEKLFLYQDLCNSLRKQNDTLLSKAKDLQTKFAGIQKDSQQKISIINKMKEKQKQSEEKIKNLQQKVQELKASDMTAKLKKKYKEIAKINELLQKQLQLSNSKIIQLERAIEQKASSVYVDEIQKLRESNMNLNSLWQTKHRIATVTNENFYSKSRAFSTKNHRF